MGFTIYTVSEAAKEARVPLRTMERLLHNGRGPALTRIGRKRLVRSDMLASWIEANTSAPAPVAQAA